MGQEYVGWPLYRSYGTYQLTTEGYDIDLSTVKTKIRQYERDGKIMLVEKFLGLSQNWDSFDGRFAKRRD